MRRALPDNVVITGEPLTAEEVVAVARHSAKVTIADGVAPAMVPARARVEEHLAEDRAIYGITTGFGSLADVRIPAEDLATLQRNLIRSHAAAAGEPLPDEVVRAMMLL
ncbi:MAG: aromatic amino acid lyase, partial [Actinomycetota bacterium]